MTLFYNLAFIIFGIGYLPFFLMKLRQAESPSQLIRERLGFFSRETQEKFLGKKILWIHAVSVGEVMVVRHFIEQFLKRQSTHHFVLTTVTPTGQKIAKKLASENDCVTACYFPFDLTGVVRRFLKILGPECLLLAETEIWPNLLTEAKRNRVPVGIINGRLSKRSAKRYGQFRTLFKPLFQKLDFVLVQTEEDANRFASLGVEVSRIQIAGNMKFDNVPSVPFDPSTVIGMKEKWGYKSKDQILVAGSTHPGEEGLILRVLQKLQTEYPSLKVIFAPRHIERTKELKLLCQKKGFSVRLASESQESFQNTVLILDKIGVLKDLYAIADAVIMGGSFVRRGGQNPIEPAYFKKTILHGPHTFNFHNAYLSLNQEGGALVVRDESQLEFALKRLMSRESERRLIGENAYQTIRKLCGSTERHIEWLIHFMGRRNEKERNHHVEVSSKLFSPSR